MPPAVTSPTFADAARFWLKLGFVSFGGPAGQIAIMHREVVERRQWLGERDFTGALNFCMLLPGPEALQLAIYLGWNLHGFRGDLVAGLGFIGPAIVLLLGLSWAYARFAALRERQADGRHSRDRRAQHRPCHRRRVRLLRLAGGSAPHEAADAGGEAVIHGVGTDIVAIARIERMLNEPGECAAAKLLAPSEMEKYRQAPKPAAWLAKRFAAKEALGKALGLGLRDPATLHNIAVLSDGIGRPSFEYAPPLAEWMQARRLRAHLSLSDETDIALAFVVVETEDKS